MKKKNFNKKLRLSKETIASLNSNEMEKIVGGDISFTRPILACLIVVTETTPDDGGDDGGGGSMTFDGGATSCNTCPM